MSVNKPITKKYPFDLLKNFPHCTFKGKYGDRSREFVCGYWGKNPAATL